MTRPWWETMLLYADVAFIVVLALCLAYLTFQAVKATIRGAE